ncbi:cobalamin biosynthesis protein CbiX [Brevibacillus humidisoli]|uniref:sirohydrochlorin chelatase n=1 Tax=Brevibacillus humidisoli TaxID=2895522 RepID=UPI001E50E37C|nr:CbiX/SirB N-terminal domain-containing protein [Brevibacillus humidisoli]UFJ41056.1 cobalamin biosynthesis protein CbiX [Brevibacillus humidisoli]
MKKKSGVLIIGHGSSSASWVQLVDHAVDQLDLPVPVVACFLELVEGRLIEDGIRQLEREGVERIIAVPLFVASGSTHIDEIGYMLGALQLAEPEEDWERIETDAEIVYCPPMDDHPLIEEIVLERAKELSADPASEVVMLVGHGADEGTNHLRWERLLQRLAVAVRERGGFKGATYGTLHPDNLHKRARAVTRKNRALIVPLFLSEGYFTQQVIPSRLEGLPYTYSGKTYLPHPHVSDWMQDVIKQVLQA